MQNNNIMVVTPFESVGILSFIDDRQNIRSKLNDSYKEGVKEFDSIKDYYDYFVSKDIFVYYDESDNVAAFEFFKPFPVFQEINLLQTPYNELLHFFRKIDIQLIVDLTGFRSDMYGIGVHAPDSLENPESPPESAIIYKKGYYN